MKNPPIKVSFIKAVFLSILFPLFVASQAMAAIITWDSAPTTVDVTDPTQISTQGTLFFAATDYVTSAVVNGITFETFGTNPKFTPGGTHYTGYFTPTTEYKKLLANGTFVTTATGPTSPSVISGLTVGDQYKIQIWVPIWNVDWPTQIGTVSGGTNNTPTVHNSVNPITTTQFICGTFTATATTQSLYLFPMAGPGGYAGFSALQVRDVTPPSLTFTGTAIGTATGSHSYDSGTGTLTVTGNGNGLWPGGGGFHPDSDYFAYSTATYTGDVEIVARLVSTSFPDAYNGQAGLMIRASNSTNEINRAATFFVPNANNWGHSMAYIGSGPTTGGRSDYFNSGGYLAKPPLNPPYWMKLVRVGNNYGTYWSFDGRDWMLLGNASGGALFGTGAFNVGLFVDSYFGSGSTSAVFDNVYIGPPRLKYKTSWIGNTSGGVADGYSSNKIFALWVKPDGTCYANADWDEQGQSVKAYKDGKVAFYLNAEVTPTISNSGLSEGNITGNTTHLFMGTANHGNGVYQTDFNGNNPLLLTFTTPLGSVGGLAASDTRLFVSDATNGTVHIFDLTSGTPTELTPIAAGVIAHPGPIAYDGTNFWIIDCGSPFALTNYVSTQAGYTPGVKCFSPAGVYQRSLPAGLSNPTALAKHPTMDRLYVCENGANQNIPYYSGLLGTPAYAGSVGLGSASAGVPGGIWRSANPGTIYEAGNGDYARFYGPTGVGFDSSGNIYVACNGTNAGAVGGTDLRKFDTSGNLVWKQFGLEFCQVGDFDPQTDGADIYTTEEHFGMNYANTAPGSEWSYNAFTRNPFVANDTRNAFGLGANGVQARQVGGKVFMYTNGQGGVSPMVFYRFNNQGSVGQETAATPYASLIWTYVAGVPTHQLWFDNNGDGLVTAGETTSIPATLGVFASYDVDSQGDIWLAFTQGGGGQSAIGRLACPGTQTIGSPVVATVPSYSLANYTTFLCPDPIRMLQSIKYDRANDVMYCVGTKADGKWVLARYDNWKASLTPDEHTARWVTPLPDAPTDITALYYGSAQWYMGMGFAGDKVFVGDLWGPISVYDANLGNKVITLNPGPEVSATMGWEDMRMGLSAMKRSTGEYLVMVEDAGVCARTLLYRWTPTADTTVPGASTQLTATGRGHAIALAWIGPVGTVTSYNIYRGTTSGSLTLYQSNVDASSFIDTNVTPGTTYYYTVAAVSTVGTGAQSNQASAAALSTQVEFVKYDLTTKGTWHPAGSTPAGTQVYGTEGYYIANTGSDIISPASYVSSITYVNSSSTVWSNPSSDPIALQIPGGGANRISSTHYYPGSSHSCKIAFSSSDLLAGKWHQVAMYMMIDGSAHTDYDRVEVLDGDGSSNIVLDTRYPMDYGAGKWLVWNVCGNVTIRMTAGYTLGFFSGIFFDPVATFAPTKAWWKLDETGAATVVTDSSGAGNNATKAGGTWDTGGKINGCVNFGGTNATSNIGLPTNVFNLPKMTLSLWFKTTAGTVLIGTQNTSSGTPAQFAPVLYVGTDNNLHGGFYTGAIRTMTSNVGTVLNATNFQHAALTSDGVTQTLYVNGQVTAVLTAPVTPLAYGWCGQGYTAGWPNLTGTTNYFSGRVDDVRLYDRVLSPGEIWKLSH